MSLAKGIIWFAGLLFVLYGVGFAAFPVELATYVTGAGPTTASGVIDMRSTYGGLTIAVGLVILILGSRRETIRVALQSTAIILVAMAATRTLGFVVDGSPNSWMVAYLVSEIGGALLALYARKALPPA